MDADFIQVGPRTENQIEVTRLVVVVFPSFPIGSVFEAIDRSHSLPHGIDLPPQ